MKIIVNRLNLICEEIIPHQQYGFIKNRAITDAALDIISTMRAQEDTSKQHWLLFLDQQKAFDRVNHDFLELTLSKMNFDTKFTKLIHNLFAGQEAHIIEAGNISKSLRVERGVRQGDPLSPLLYILAFEPLIRNLNEHLQGICLGNQFFKVSAYADDLTIGIGSCTDWNEVLALVNLYESASNAKINKMKSKLVPLTPVARRVDLPNEDQFTKVEEQDTLTILGYNVSTNGQTEKSLWPTTIQKLKKAIDKLEGRNLSFKGKIVIANALILSKIWYTAYLLPPGRKQVTEINRIISLWIKGTSRMLPKYSTFQQSAEYAGLQAPIIKDMLDARLISVWLKLLTSSSLWAIHERTKISLTLRHKRNISPLQALSLDKPRTKAWPSKWKPYLLAWHRIKGKISSTTNWPWKLEEIKMAETQGSEITTKKVLELLRKTSTPSISLRISPQVPLPLWLSLKSVNNKKRDIFWRLFHKALPLGYRLKHISPSESGNCIWCPNDLQTPEHFAIECQVSFLIWKESYNFLNITSEKTPPSTLEEVFRILDSPHSQVSLAKIWLHINSIYEIWCRYTAAKWGEVDIPLTSFTSITRNHISREIHALKYNASNNLSKTSKIICKYISCT